MGWTTLIPGSAVSLCLYVCACVCVSVSPFAPAYYRVPLIISSPLLPLAVNSFEKPSTIQQRAILPVIKGNEVIAQAQSGTGKTATFAISLLQRIDTSKKECQALVLAPTRELASQIQKVRRVGVSAIVGPNDCVLYTQ